MSPTAIKNRNGRTDPLSGRHKTLPPDKIAQVMAIQRSEIAADMVGYIPNLVSKPNIVAATYKALEAINDLDHMVRQEFHK